MTRINFEGDLNAEQFAAATAGNGPMLILAAAGTGKTRTLVYRVAYLVSQGVCLDRILLLTFTNRAAREMLERAAALVGGSVGDLWGGTFHHMANRILRRHAALLGFSYAMDFDDLLVQCRELFRSHPAALAIYQERFLHVLVDEYQDTNILQAQVVDAVAARHGNVFVVGDDFQSIYSWRGADFRNILSFPERHAGTTVFRLETNYRSVPEVLAVANACIAGNPEQFQKTLRATRPAGGRPRVASLRDGEHQARFVVEEVERLWNLTLSHGEVRAHGSPRHEPRAHRAIRTLYPRSISAS